MRFDVRLNPTAERVLDRLYVIDEPLANALDDVLDQLEHDPTTCEHEPWPDDRGAAYVTHIYGSSWYVAWIYAPGEGNTILVGRLDALLTNDQRGRGGPRSQGFWDT